MRVRDFSSCALHVTDPLRALHGAAALDEGLWE